MTEPEIIEQVASHGSRHVVLTGGEPMVAAGIHSLAAALKAADHHLTIETAGTVPPDGIACDLVSLSPKLANASPRGKLPEAWVERHETRRWQPEIVRAWIEAVPFQFKFVICDQSDLDEVEAMLGELGSMVRPEQVFLMPEGIEAARLREKAGWLAEICTRRGYRYGHRLHIELYGNTRGT